MSAAGLALLAIGLFSAKNDIARVRGIDKIVALTPVCFSIPLAIFGAEHLSSQQSLLALVPSYMPWRMFWVYFVGFALIAASVSIATKRQVRWSGLLFGGMMFLFVAMLHLPGAVTAGGRIPWTIVVREMSFGGAGWVLAGIATGRDREGQGRGLITVGPVANRYHGDLFRRSALSASAGTSRSSARQADAPMDSRSRLHRLCNGCVSHRYRCLLSAGAEHSHSGHIYGRLDCAPGCGNLRARPKLGR